jgi:hypothetical protein
MGKFITLTSISKNIEIFVNVDYIGHLYRIPEHTKCGVESPGYTKVGVVTHNDGGFVVKESVDEVMEKIKKTME